jgi:hypothetical protein
VTASPKETLVQVSAETSLDDDGNINPVMKGTDDSEASTDENGDPGSDFEDD